MFSVTSWIPKSTLQHLSSLKSYLSLCCIVKMTLWGCNVTVSCQGWISQERAATLFTFFSLVVNIPTAVSSPSPPWENQHHPNTRTLCVSGVKCLYQCDRLWTLLIVVLSRHTVFTMALGLSQMADFQCSYMLYLSGISNGCLSSNVWEVIREEKGTILMEENASADEREGKCSPPSDIPLWFPKCSRRLW